ncbi:DUF5343 domain-containing protein [Burkholderia lata]|uniref:DUF5343 domain-containing protein n=1 Tax=Burkholderia lata (strain ATCC 17760 / DSM 23089 / LMG 22485 / NCIMB 9086 / R18194 / 383) TaxID=482957 RepID=UPI0015835EF6|nr:DUF5343 domain-containing protein [Burkholderia lata]
MAAELPYLSSYKNVAELFQRILAAKKPDSFTTRYLSDTVGLKSAGDRQLITLLKTLGFLDSAGRPTVDYDQLKNASRAPKAIAAAIRRAYEPLYAANEGAHELPSSELKGLISQVAGSDTGVTSKIQGTYSSLVKLADFSSNTPVHPEASDPPLRDGSGEFQGAAAERASSPRLRPEFHYNIQIHLPANAVEETYLNIFNALRKSFES